MTLSETLHELEERGIEVIGHSLRYSTMNPNYYINLQGGLTLKFTTQDKHIEIIDETQRGVFLFWPKIVCESVDGVCININEIRGHQIENASSINFNMFDYVIYVIKKMLNF